MTAKLRVAWHRDGSHAPAREHREHPLDPAADQRHHDVAAFHTARRERSREPTRPGDELAKVPDLPLAATPDRDERRFGGWVPLEHVLDEVHGGVVCRPPGGSAA